MSSTHYCAARLECGCLLTCGHGHESVRGAIACRQNAGAYVVAIEFQTMRSLDNREETQYQWAVAHDPRRSPSVSNSPAIASPESIDLRYAVMTRIRVAGQWSWTTWMGFATYGDAAAHAQEGDKVVRFRSPEWHELRRQTMVPAPSHAGRDPDLARTSPDESLVETAFRFLDACGFDERPAARLRAKGNSRAQEGVEQDEIEERKRA